MKKTKQLSSTKLADCIIEGKLEIKNSIIGSNSKIIQNNDNKFLLGEGSQISI